MTRLAWFFPLALAACTMPPPDLPGRSGAGQEVRLEAFDCDRDFDCYLTVTPAEGGPARRTLCTATACNQWRAGRSLPAEDRGRVVTAIFGVERMERDDNPEVVIPVTAITSIRGA